MWVPRPTPRHRHPWQCAAPRGAGTWKGSLCAVTTPTMSPRDRRGEVPGGTGCWPAWRPLAHKQPGRTRRPQDLIATPLMPPWLAAAGAPPGFQGTPGLQLGARSLAHTHLPVWLWAWLALRPHLPAPLGRVGGHTCAPQTRGDLLACVHTALWSPGMAGERWWREWPVQKQVFEKSVI